MENGQNLVKIDYLFYNGLAFLHMLKEFATNGLLKEPHHCEIQTKFIQKREKHINELCAAVNLLTQLYVEFPH